MNYSTCQFYNKVNFINHFRKMAGGWQISPDPVKTLIPDAVSAVCLLLVLCSLELPTPTSLEAGDIDIAEEGLPEGELAPTRPTNNTSESCKKIQFNLERGSSKFKFLGFQFDEVNTIRFYLIFWSKGSKSWFNKQN